MSSRNHRMNSLILAGSSKTASAKNVNESLSLTFVTADKTKEDQFEMVKSFLPLRLELQKNEESLPATKGNDHFVPFQNLLRESLIALRTDDIQTASHKFRDATLFLQEHMNGLGSFSAHIDAFEFVSGNFTDFANWLRNHPIEYI